MCSDLVCSIICISASHFILWLFNLPYMGYIEFIEPDYYQ